MAAGIILIREAGGFVADTSGGTDMFGTRSIAAGNEYMLKSVLELVQRPVPASLSRGVKSVSQGRFQFRRNIG
jgi:myo-inositol-1(or 4)-monophosphatase